jgi:FMN phosphatase YigB (HAD superfamily)
MSIPARLLLTTFPGTRQLLPHVRGTGARVAVVSNAQWRDGEAYRQDFADLALADLVDAYVSSVDVGYRKPHETMFRTALDALRADPGSTVMVGNSVANDIAPAAALWLRTIDVSIEDEPPTTSPAEVICTSLADVQQWIADHP